MSALKNYRRALIKSEVIRGTLKSASGTDSINMQSCAGAPLKQLCIQGSTSMASDVPSVNAPQEYITSDGLELSVQSKNLAFCSSENKGGYNTISTVLSQNSFTYGKLTNTNSTAYATFYLPVKNKMAYRISFKYERKGEFAGQPRVLIFGSNNRKGDFASILKLVGRISLEQGEISASFTNASYPYAAVVFYLTENGDSVSNDAIIQIDDFLMTEGFEETEFEPYFEPVKVSIQADIAQLDKLLLSQSEKRVYIKRAEQRIDLADVNWNNGISTTQTEYVFFYSSEVSEPYDKSGFCSRGGWISEMPTSLGQGEIAVGFVGGRLTLCVSTSLVPYTGRPAGGIYATVNDLYAFLEQNPTCVVYRLKNERIEELGAQCYRDVCSLLAPYGANANFKVSSSLPVSQVDLEYYSLAEQDTVSVTVCYLNGQEILRNREYLARRGALCVAEPIHIDGYVPLDGAVKSVVRENTVLKIYYKKEKANE